MVLSQIAIHAYILIFLIRQHTTLTERIARNHSCPMLKMSILYVLAIIFPTHFSNIVALVFKSKVINLEDNLKKTFEEFEPATSDDTEQLNQSFRKLTSSIKANKREHVKMIKLKNATARCETFFETLPTSVLLISLGLLSYFHPALRLFLEEGTFKDQISIPYKLVVIYQMITASFACVSTVLKIRLV